jgi:hypothetical protein
MHCFEKHSVTQPLQLALLLRLSHCLKVDYLPVCLDRASLLTSCLRCYCVLVDIVGIGVDDKPDNKVVSAKLYPVSSIMKRCA